MPEGPEIRREADAIAQAVAGKPLVELELNLSDGSVPESVAEQAEIALGRTREILRLQGLTMADLVEVVSYHVNLKDTIDEFLPVKARYTERPFPAWSIIGVEALALPPLKIEIRSVAVFPEAK